MFCLIKGEKQEFSHGTPHGKIGIHCKLDQSNSFCGSPNTEEIENSFKVIPVRVRPLGLQV